MKVIFDVQHLYYLPQFLPVQRELAARGHETLFVFHEELECAEALAVVSQGLPQVHVKGARDAHREYLKQQPDWLIFGNGYDHLDELPAGTRTALLYHGIGVKRCYYGAGLMRMTLRFVEGEYRERELQRRYPEAKLRAVGFAKLDPLFRDPAGIRLDLAALGLDPSLPTVLYAPTYYPSSIERLPADLPARFEGCNLLVKPHHFSWTKSYYAPQRKRLESWRRFDNAFVAGPGEVSLLPFMAAADILVSEASSALFEFAALDRPVVWCDFFHRRWAHRGPLAWRLEKRLDRSIEQYADIASHAATPNALVEVVKQALAFPAERSEVRCRYTRELIGPTDGQASRRIADALETF
ncbi:MAG TPA: CDP-glycerol glycerophosphotransferase family protein [Gammaproteobacteria bacterium]|nr:CDP-glycerol glycerophosphotransferase family protein [Gammaproteobacteria bacterium]